MTLFDNATSRDIGKISLPDGADFCLYALQSTIPLLPTKQRRNHPADWMETDARVACPDPACRLIMRIDRAGRVPNQHSPNSTGIHGCAGVQLPRAVQIEPGLEGTAG